MVDQELVTTFAVHFWENERVTVIIIKESELNGVVLKSLTKIGRPSGMKPGSTILRMGVTRTKR